MLRNFPPGVTGNEYEISGPDEERQEDRFCSQCDDDTPHNVYRYRLQLWGECIPCGHEFDDIVEPFFD